MANVGGTPDAGSLVSNAERSAVGEAVGMRDHAVTVVASGVVAPNGIGEDFYDALFSGESGLRSLNDWRNHNGDLLLGIRTLYLLYLTFTKLDRDHMLRLRVLRRLNEGIAEFLELPGNEAAVVTAADVHETIDSFVCLLRGQYPDRPPEIAPDTDEETGVETRRDAFGVVPSEGVLTFLMPLCAELVAAQPSQRVGIEIDPHLADALFLTVPRTAQLSLVASLHCLAEAAGSTEALKGLPPADFDAIEREQDAFAIPTRTGTITRHGKTFACEVIDESELEQRLRQSEFATYMEAAIAAVKDIRARILGSLGQDEARIGVYVGTGGSNTEAGTRLAAKVALAADLTRRNVIDPIDAPGDSTFGDLHVDPGEGVGIPAIWAGEWHWALYNDANQFNYGYTAGLICRVFELRGEQTTVATGCCSGAAAALAGVRTLRRDRADLILAVGADCALGPETFLPFLVNGRLRALRVDPAEDTEEEQEEAYFDACNPHPRGKARAGWVLGEGAAAVLLTRADAPQTFPLRRTFVQATVMGNDGNGVPWPSVRTRVLRQALEPPVDGGSDGERTPGGRLPPGHGLVLGFALGDHTYDMVESDALFGALAGLEGEVPGLASIKSEVGHSLGGSSMMAVAVAHRMVHQASGLRSVFDAPPFFRKKPIPRPRDPETGVVALPRLDWVVTNGSGMGGTGVSLLLSREPASTRPSEPES
jgi:3-oxoacyl-(acyl-carrier-protein) synthase